MEPTSDRRFDANFVGQILLEIAHEHSLEKLLQKLIERALERPHIVCPQVWLNKRATPVRRSDPRISHRADSFQRRAVRWLHQPCGAIGAGEGV
jgi:hypothetical protein